MTMTLKNWLDFFKEHRAIKIFYLQHLMVLTKIRPQTLKVGLKRLHERKVIQRICRGYYANPFNPPRLEEISAVIYQPSYISLESALSRWGILSQIPQVLTCVTTKLPRKFSSQFGNIEYHQIQKGHFWGFVQEGGYFIASPEKALLDYIYFKKQKDVRRALFELNLKGLRLRKLKTFSKKMKIVFPGENLEFS